MSRDLTTSVETEIAKAAVEPVVFCKMELSSDLYLWSGYGNISWDSQTWTGLGDLGKITPVKETVEVAAQSMNFELSGIPSTLLAIALDEDYQGRAVTLWLGFISNNAVVSDPINIFSGRLDVMQITENGATSTITVNAQSRLADLLKKREWRYTNEDQQIAYPGDKGFEFVNALQDKEIKWGPY